MLCENAGPVLVERFSQWFKAKGWQPHAHQLAMVEAARAGKSSLLIAPTGGGKTLAGFLPSLVDLAEGKNKGLHTLYISPLKALAADIQRNLQAPIADMGLDISIEMRTGDTSSSRRQRQIKKPPQILLTTPESLELLLSYAGAEVFFAGLRRLIIDEVHALAPNKRGHMTALCIAYLRSICPGLTVSGLSATVAAPEALARWIGEGTQIIDAGVGVKPRITLLKTKARLPWSGYMGTYAIADIYAQLKRAKTTIVFVNTRAQAELLFQQLWEFNTDNLPIGLHHGSLEREHRLKVEAAMNAGALRAIVATASLDLGLDWGQVDLVMQVGAPRSISRLLQRIGRSNHRLDEPSEALLVPCNRFEMIECIAVMRAIDEGMVDGEALQEGGLDVLAQFVMNAACGEGFDAEVLYGIVRRAAPYRGVSREMFELVLRFIESGGYALRVYDQFKRIVQNEAGLWVASKVAIRRHRMNIGTIVEYETLPIALRRAKSQKFVPLGKIEEYFIQGLQPGDTFIFAGRLLSYKGIFDNRVEAEPAVGPRPKIPSFKGGRLPLSISVAERVRELMQDKSEWGRLPKTLQDWLALQEEKSSLPDSGHLLVETFEHEEKQFLMVYSFAGRNANQTLGMLISSQMEASDLLPLGFVANDYVLALWSLKTVRDPGGLVEAALAQESCEEWIESSQMAKRTFRDVALISGLVERGYPGGRKTGRQVTISTDLLYDVLRKHEPGHVLLKATRLDVLARLGDVTRLRTEFAGLALRHRHLEHISPLAVPLVLDVIGSEEIDGKGRVEMLTAELRDMRGDALLEEAQA